jgi:formyl-CoA transferase
MYEAVAALLTFNAGIHFATGESPRRRGNGHATIVPYETFEAADGWINLGVANDDLWRRFCAVAERADIVDDPRFAGTSDRVRNRDELIPIVRHIIRQHPRDAWLERLDVAGVPCGAIRSVGEVCDGALLRERGMIAEVGHPSAGTVRMVKSPLGLSATPLDRYAPPPRLGEHTDRVLRDLLGLGDGEIEALRADRVVQ